VGAGSVLRVKGDERSFFANNGTLIVGIGGFVDGRFFNHGTITNLAKLRDEGFQNRGIILNTASGEWHSDDLSLNWQTGTIVNDGKWRIDRVENRGTLVNNGTVQANDLAKESLNN